MGGPVPTLPGVREPDRRVLYRDLEHPNPRVGALIEDLEMIRTRRASQRSKSPGARARSSSAAEKASRASSHAFRSTASLPAKRVSSTVIHPLWCPCGHDDTGHVGPKEHGIPATAQRSGPRTPVPLVPHSNRSRRTSRLALTRATHNPNPRPGISRSSGTRVKTAANR